MPKTITKKPKKFKNLPYTIVGGTSLPRPKMRIVLTGEGIKEMAKQIKKTDSVEIVQWADCNKEADEMRYYQRIAIIEN